MTEIQTLEGQAVTLRPLVENDVPLLARWLFDPDILHWLQLSEDPPEFKTLEAVRQRYERMRDDEGTKVWRIDSKEGKPIGQIELVDIHSLQRRAEIHLCIGAKDIWGKGYGTQAIRLVLHFAFENLKLRRVFLIVDEDNKRGIRCFNKSGFKREGLLREHRLRHGQPLNMVTMGILRQEYSGNSD